MSRATLAGGMSAAILVLLAFTTRHPAGQQDGDPTGATSLPAAVSPLPSMATRDTDAGQGLLYGRVTTDDGAIFEGRLRFGGEEEAFWGHYFNGAKAGNPWAGHVARERLRKRRPLEIFGLEIAGLARRIDLDRPFMARFGDIARIDARGRDLRVTLRSGTVFRLDRFGADDFADGVRVWDDRRGIVDLDEWRVRTIEFLPASGLGVSPDRLHGTVSTRHADFTGFLQWDREASVGHDQLEGQGVEGEVSLRFATVRSIARRSSDSSLVTLLDGRRVVLSGTREAGRGHRGIYVDDPRYGRVLVSWDAFERLDLSPAGGGPAYDDFPVGRPLAGTVTTRSGRRLVGRLVYDLDESETTETLDAPYQGVDYTIPFGLVASIVPADRGGSDTRHTPHARVTLHGGEELPLERAGDLAESNGGMLVFVDGGPGPEYVPWTEVQRIDFDRPPAMQPPRPPR